MEEGNHQAGGHTHQQGRSRQNEHEKIDGPLPEKASVSFDSEDNIEGAAQRTKNPGGGPEESTNAQYADSPPMQHDFQDAFPDPRIQGGEPIEPASPLLPINGVVKTNQNEFANIFCGVKSINCGIPYMS